MNGERLDEKVRLEAPEHVYRRLVRILISSVLQEKDWRAADKLRKETSRAKAKGVSPP